MPKKYSLLTISGVSNVWVIGGTLEGERDQHKGKSGEWGYGLRIGKGAKHVTVSNLVSKKMWGDGFYVQDAEDVRFCGVTADANRRQGLSIIQADGLLVLNSVFKNTHGTRPAAGIDFEPDKVEQEDHQCPHRRLEIPRQCRRRHHGRRQEGPRHQDRDDPQHVPQQSALRGGIRADRSPRRSAATGRSAPRPRPEAASTPMRSRSMSWPCRTIAATRGFVIDKIRKKKKEEQGAD